MTSVCLLLLAVVRGCPRMRTSNSGDRMLARGYDTPNVTYPDSYQWVETSSVKLPVNSMVQNQNQSFLWRKQRLFDQFVHHADQVRCTQLLQGTHQLSPVYICHRAHQVYVICSNRTRMKETWTRRRSTCYPDWMLKDWWPKFSFVETGSYLAIFTCQLFL